MESEGVGVEAAARETDKMDSYVFLTRGGVGGEMH